MTRAARMALGTLVVLAPLPFGSVQGWTTGLLAMGLGLTMVLAALAWNLKSWYGLLMPNRQRGLELVRMEFRRFLHAVVLIPCQVVRTARRVVWRVLGYNDWLKDFFATWERLQRLVLIQ